MKYLVFNIVVAGALIYLAVGGEMNWPGLSDDIGKPVETTAAPTKEEPAQPTPSIEAMLDKLKPAIEETATLVAEQVSEDVAARTKEELAQQIAALEQKQPKPETLAPTAQEAPAPATSATTPATVDKDVPEQALPPLPEMTVETPAVHEPLDEVAPGTVAQAPKADAPANATEQPSQPDEDTAAQPTQPKVKLAEGAEMMSPRDRQRELDVLVQDMELMFLEKAGE